MTRKDQNKILDNKIESNINQYKVDRLNAEISAFSGGDLNKYEFLTRKDLNYKPNALDKAIFELSPLGKSFSTGLDKTAQGYQEEGVIKLLKDIRDNLAGNVNSQIIDLMTITIMIDQTDLMIDLMIDLIIDLMIGLMIDLMINLMIDQTNLMMKMMETIMLICLI